MIEKTFAMIKPDAIENGYTGLILCLTELNKFKILKLEKTTITKKQAQEFYDVHKEKPFYNELVNYVTSGQVILMALEKENAVVDWRTLMGATDPLKANPGSLRRMFGTSIGSNATHGSDSLENAKKELKLFFPLI